MRGQEQEAFANRIAEWARRRPDVRAVLLVGSQARADRPADEWADVDLIVVVDDPTRYLDDRSWLLDLGEPLVSFVERSAPPVLPTVSAFFGDGLDADFAFLAGERAEELARGGIPPDAARMLARGYRLVYDELGLETGLRQAAEAAEPAPLPAEEDFRDVVSEFWYRALWAERKLRRGELRVAVRSCNCALQELLGAALSWDAHLRGEDAWYGGRFFEQWADREAVAVLPQTIAPYHRSGAHAALVATAELFERVTRRVADRLGYAYPVVDHGRVREWL